MWTICVGWRQVVVVVVAVVNRFSGQVQPLEPVANERRLYRSMSTPVRFACHIFFFPRTKADVVIAVSSLLSLGQK